MIRLSIALVVSSGCASVGANALTKPLRVPIIGRPHAAHDMAWRTADGLTLRGWVFEPEGAPKGLVVFLHGKDINRQHFSAEVTRFTRRGYRVLAYDQRAHGASQGTRTTFGAFEVDDLRRALDRLEATRVVLIGESLGAAVALQAAAVDARVVAVVAGASFSDLPTVAKERRPFFFSEADVAAALAVAEEETGAPLSTISPEGAAPDITAPVLVLHGTHDGFIHPDHARRLHAAAPTSRLVWLEGVGHIDVLLTNRAWVLIEAFVDSLDGPPS